LVLVDERGQPADVLTGTPVSPHRLHRSRQHAVGIADGDSDADRTDVDAEPTAASRIWAARVSRPVRHPVRVVRRGHAC